MTEMLKCVLLQYESVAGNEVCAKERVVLGAEVYGVVRWE